MLQYEADVIGIIYNGLVHSKGKYAILQQIKKELTWATGLLHLDYLSQHHLSNEAIRIYNVVSRKTFSALRQAKRDLGKTSYQENLKSGSNAVFDALNSETIQNRNILKVVNGVLNHQEVDSKRMEALELISSARSDTEHYSPFFLCSYHLNSAKDHAPWQGKVYIDEGWKDYVRDETIRAKIQAYIYNHKIKTVQWVMGSPVYMCIRPNCKHYMEPVAISEVLGASVNRLLKRKGMIVEDTVLSDKDRYLRGYQERYALHQKLWKNNREEKKN